MKLVFFPLEVFRSRPPDEQTSCPGYLPRRLENLDSHYGTAADLRCLVEAFHKAGVLSVVDCVLNHRCADKQVDCFAIDTLRFEFKLQTSAACIRNSPGRLDQIL